MMALGLNAGFRGNSEHTNLLLHQVKVFTYAADHPLFPNHQGVRIDDISDKTHKLDMGTGKKRETNGVMDFPVLSDGVNGNVKNDVGGTVLRLKAKIEALPPSKKENAKHRFYRQVSKKNKFLVNNPLGASSVRKRIQYAYKFLGISNWKELTSHALRSAMITKLSNSESVNITETMAAARHSTAGASAMYQTRSTESSCNRYRALFNINDDTPRPAKIYTVFGLAEAPTVPEKNNNINVKDENVEIRNDQNLGIEEMSVDHEEEIEDEKPYSEHTQAAVEGLRRDLARVENSSSVTSSGQWMWDLEAPRQAAIPRPTPRQTSRFLSSNRSQRIQSRREREIHALRQRVLVLENEERMQSFPFRSTEDESEELYQDYVGERDFEREMLIASRRRRSNRFRRNHSY